MAFLVASRVGVCGFHWLMNVGHMGLYNDAARNQRIEKRIDRLLRTRDFAPIVDIGDDSFLATLCAMKLQDASETPVYSFEPRELSRLRWQAISESNGVSLAIIAGHPSNPQVAEVFGKEGIRNVVWNCHNYQMEDHCVMEALSYWCMVNSMRGIAGERAEGCSGAGFVGSVDAELRECDGDGGGNGGTEWKG